MIWIESVEVALGRKFLDTASWVVWIRSFGTLGMVLGAGCLGSLQWDSRLNGVVGKVEFAPRFRSLCLGFLSERFRRS